jgi:hypothetical protein
MNTQTEPVLLPEERRRAEETNTWGAQRLTLFEAAGGSSLKLGA